MMLSCLHAAGIIEKDKHGDVMWTWSYPMFTEDQKEFVLGKCCLTWAKSEKTKANQIVPFAYSQYCKHWYYLFTSATSEESSLKSVSQFCIVVASKDFNPEKYAVLSRVLSKTYDQTGSPVTLLEQYLKVITLGSCKSNNNGIFNVDDFDEKRAYIAASLKDVITNFGIESILLYTAVLLKKRILVYHDKVELLLEFTRTLPALAWHRQDWSLLHPWIDSMDAVQGLPCYVAGTCDEEVRRESDEYDVYVDIPQQAIEILPHAKESLTLGKIHKEVAKMMIELAEDESTTNQQLIKAIDGKTKEILSKLRSLGGDGEAGVSVENIKSKNLNQTTENFLINLAAAERLLMT